VTDSEVGKAPKSFAEPSDRSSKSAKIGQIDDKKCNHYSSDPETQHVADIRRDGGIDRVIPWPSAAAYPCPSPK
jgi:hypothetical protein